MRKVGAAVTRVKQENKQEIRSGGPHTTEQKAPQKAISGHSIRYEKKRGGPKNSDRPDRRMQQEALAPHHGKVGSKKTNNEVASVSAPVADNVDRRSQLDRFRDALLASNLKGTIDFPHSGFMWMINIDKLRTAATQDSLALSNELVAQFIAGPGRLAYDINNEADKGKARISIEADLRDLIKICKQNTPQLKEAVS